MQSEQIPVFIGGSGRSGTTLAVDMLGLHSELSPIYETKFLMPMAATLLSPFLQGKTEGITPHIEAQLLKIMDEWASELEGRSHNKADHERYFHGPHYHLFSYDFAMEATRFLLRGAKAGSSVEAFRYFIESLFDQHARLDEKPRWINKAPGYAKVMDFLKLVFPNLKYINCVRDGRDTAVSVMGRSWGPDTWEDAAHWWIESVSKSVSFTQKHPEICFTLRYEVLVNQPETVLPDLWAFLGVPDETEQVLGRYNQPDGPSLSPVRTGRWRSEAEPADVKRFEEIAGHFLMALDYPLSDANS